MSNGKVHRDVVVIGGSAGALEPLKQVITDLPADLPAAVFVTLHISASSKSALGTILNRIGGIQAVVPKDGDPVRPGFLYTPTPDRHLELHDGTIRLTHGPRINGMRPSIDVLFRSAARTFGPRVVGVVLSGGLDDGSAGLAAIRAAGGFGIVQDPAEAQINSMPKTAIEVAAPQQVLSAEEIAKAIHNAVHGLEQVEKERKTKGGVGMEVVGAKDTPGTVTGVTCPDCSGSIWLQEGDGGEIAFACRVGHSYSPESFAEIQAETVENALWAGVRSLEEQSSFAAAMAERAAKFDDQETARRYGRRRRVADANAEVLRKVIMERAEA